MEVVWNVFGPLWGFFGYGFGVWLYAAFFILAIFMGYFKAPFILWFTAGFFVMLGFNVLPITLIIYTLICLSILITPFRRNVISRLVMKLMKLLKLVPSISRTESEALEAGALWLDKQYFSGKVNGRKLMNENYPKLTEEEEAFLNGPVEELCKMICNFDIYSKRRIPENVWKFLKKEKFFGMIVPKDFGGLGFSAFAHSAVIMKLNSRSTPVTVTVMVPNSLGPAELLIHYGTKKQQDYYLPRLASGEDIPCFALTEPEAGSDAASIQAEGVLFKENGKLKIRLNWNKRWITLAAISTVMGVAFRLRDPDNLLETGKEDIGITCALVSTDKEGITLGRRHDPLGVPFYNCPTQGKDVVISIEDVIGEEKGCGIGWNMLMESLSAGRGISLPSQSVGTIKLLSRYVTAHAVNRNQFGISISSFDGVKEPLAKILGSCYMLEAVRCFTTGALDSGVKPPVITAISKYITTELSRQVINHSMDILGGSGISKGKRNLIVDYYLTAPIGITVEGANILTRTLMIFGQGALRAHPFAFKVVNSIMQDNLKEFDRAFFGHIKHVITNVFRCVVLSLTRGVFVSYQGDSSVSKYFRRLSWSVACFALMTDVVMALYGGALKKKEMLTGRFADVLSNLYMATAVLRRYEAEHKRTPDLPLVHYSLKQSFYNIQTAFDGIFKNLDIGRLNPLRLVVCVVRMWNNFNVLTRGVDDKLVSEVVESVLNTKSNVRDNLTKGIYIPTDKQEPLARGDNAFNLVLTTHKIEKKIKRAMREKKLDKQSVKFALKEALSKDIISQYEHDDLQKAIEARLDAIQVDDFSEEEYVGHKPTNRDDMPYGLISKK